LAEQKIRESELVPVVKKEPSDEVDRGFVIRQSPEENTKIEKGQKVTIVVSSGIAQVEVPEVVGMTQGDATQLLVDQELRPDPRLVASKKEPGTVIAQSPSAGEEVPKGTVVVIKVSKGEQLFDVPNVVGQDQATAEQILGDAGFEPTVETKESEEAVGTVIDQTPNGGQAAKGTTILIVVSSGPPAPQTATVPDVTGQDPGAAAALLQDAGFNVVSDTIPAQGPEEDGIVLNTDPGPNAEAEVGTTVIIYVGVFDSGGATTATP
jgi:serine/threonine-protein kinase